MYANKDIRLYVYVLILLIIITTSIIFSYNMLKKYKIKGGTRLSRRFLQNIGKKYDSKMYAKHILRMNKLNNPVLTTIDDIYEIKDSKEFKYKVSAMLPKPQVHIGQRKLIMSEIQFLTNSDAKYCLYAGSAPGNKTHTLSLLFPNIKFILIDPNIFDLKIQEYDSKTKETKIISHRTKEYDDIVHLKTDDDYKYDGNRAGDNIVPGGYVDYIKESKYKIYIIEDYMSDIYADIFKELDHIFISDIRSNIDSDTKAPSELDILWNMSMMYNWIKVLKPITSMLKFRPFYYNSTFPETFNKNIQSSFNKSKAYGIDFIANYKNSIIQMPASKLYLQTWAGKTSSELRMCIQKSDLDDIEELKNNDIDNAMFYFNNICRGMAHFKNNNSNRYINFCNCHDCALENSILVDYINKHDSLKNIRSRSVNNIRSRSVNNIRPRSVNNIRQNVNFYVTYIGDITTRLLKHMHKNNIYKKLDDSLISEFMIREKKDRDIRKEKNKIKEEQEQKQSKGNLGSISIKEE